MSEPNAAGQTAKDGSTADSTTSALSASDKETIRELDSIVDRIFKAIPTAPFYVTIPSNHPYNFGSRQEAESWMTGNLFDREEEHLQYSTFRYHEHGRDLIVCRSEVDDERDRKAKLGRMKGPDTGKTTPSHPSGPVKKISLSSFLNRGNSPATQKSSAKEDGTKSSTLRSPIEQTNGVKREGKKEPETAKGASQNRQKRPREDPPKDEIPTTPLTESAKRDSTPSKKPKLSGASHSRTVSSDASPHSHATPHGLPPLLSPIHPTNSSADLADSYDLPPILSPTLPPIIQVELEKRQKHRQRTVSSASSSSEKRLPSVTDIHAATKAHEAVTPAKGVAKVVSRKPDEAKASAVSEQATKAALGVERSSSLIVKLKYGKRNKLAVERYLKLPSNKAPNGVTEKKDRHQEKLSSEQLKSTDRIRKVEDSSGGKEQTPKEPPRKAESSSTKLEKPFQPTAGKRPRLEEDSTAVVPASKKPKVAASVNVEKRPQTPVQPAVPSPSLSTKGSVQRAQSQFLTPKKDPRTVNMMRTSSTEGAADTPGQASSTPSSVKTSETKAGPTSVPPDRKAADIQAWSKYFQAMNALGRTLKHQAQKIFGEGKSMPAEDKKRAAVVSIECILTYMAAFSATDYNSRLRGRSMDISNWRSLLPLWRVYKQHCADFPHLEGLRASLGIVITSRMSFILSQRSRPQDSPLMDNKEDFKMLAEMFQIMQQSMREARVALPISDLMKNYPKTWAAKASTTTEPQQWEQLAPGDLKGPYFLPIGADTTPVQAVRFGVQFLKDWMQQSGVAYDMQLTL